MFSDTVSYTNLVKFCIEVLNEEEGYTYIWDLDKFDHRYVLIKDLLDQEFEMK